MAIRRPQFPASGNPACIHNCMYISYEINVYYTMYLHTPRPPPPGKKFWIRANCLIHDIPLLYLHVHYLQCLFNIIEDINWSYSFFFFPINWSLIWESCIVHDVQNKNKHLYHVHPVFMVVASYNKFCFFFEVSQFYSSAHVQTSSRAN